jgi:hypothetical protein
MEKLLSLAREPNDKTSDTKICSFSYTSPNAKGIQPPVILALLRRLNSVAVMGYSGMSYDSTLLKVSILFPNESYTRDSFFLL